MAVIKRQDIVFTDPARPRVYVCDKECQRNETIKWAILFVLFTAIFLWLTVGWWHARRRIRKGLQPMGYHRWLAPKVYLPQNNQAYYAPHPHNSYPLPQYSEPPPLYTPNAVPPTYQPPPGGSKVSPQQNGTTNAR